jgi:SAM-dependent methyltransferase
MTRKISPEREHWSRFAREWTEWARTPDHDSFWAYRRALVTFIGRGEGEALDIGCGEGRVSRELKALGYRVIGVDIAPEMVQAAAGIGSAHGYALASAAALPFASGKFGLVIAYNVLMDVEDVPAALKEISRILKPDGEVMISIVHPFRDVGKFASKEPDSPFVIKGSYFGRRRFEECLQRRGLQMHFAGWSQPLEAYIAAFENAGLAVTSLREPLPDNNDPQDSRVPLFLWLKARRLAREDS